MKQIFALLLLAPTLAMAGSSDEKKRPATVIDAVIENTQEMLNLYAYPVDEQQFMAKAASAPAQETSVSEELSAPIFYSMTDYYGYQTNAACRKSITGKSVNASQFMKAIVPLKALYDEEIYPAISQNIGNQAAESMHTLYTIAFTAGRSLAAQDLRLLSSKYHGNALSADAIKDEIQDDLSETTKSAVSSLYRGTPSTDMQELIRHMTRLDFCIKKLESQGDQGGANDDKGPLISQVQCSIKDRGNYTLDSIRLFLEHAANKSFVEHQKIDIDDLLEKDAYKNEPSAKAVLGYLEALVPLYAQRLMSNTLAWYQAHQKTLAERAPIFSLDTLLGFDSLLVDEEASCPTLDGSATDAEVSESSLHYEAAKTYLNNLDNSVPLPPALTPPLTLNDGMDLPSEAITDRKTKKQEIDNLLMGYHKARNSNLMLKGTVMSNLYKSMADRSQPMEDTVILDLSKDNLPEIKNPSRAQQRAFAAQWRFNDAIGWHDAIDKAAPITVAKQSAYLLAEIRRQLFENHQLLERTLASQSISQLIQLRKDISNLTNTYNDLKKKIKEYNFAGATNQADAQAANVQKGRGATAGRSRRRRR